MCHTYAQIVELKEVISRLEAQLDPQREERIRKMYQDEARRTEDFYRKMMDDMRVEHERDMERLTRTLTDNLNAAHELQVRQENKPEKIRGIASRRGGGDISKKGIIPAKMTVEY